MRIKLYTLPKEVTEGKPVSWLAWADLKIVGVFDTEELARKHLRNLKPKPKGECIVQETIDDFR